MSNGNTNAVVSGEQTILSSNNGVLSLTNYRVKFDAKASGQSKYVSIALDNVSSCGLITQSRPALLFIAAICAVIAIALKDKDILIGLLLVAIAFVIAYLITRTAVITVSSNGGEGIAVPAKGMAREDIVAFLEAVMAAKLRFSGKLAQ